MKKKIILLLISVLFLIISCGGSKQSNETGELEGEIVFWHSFTQGPRNEFMKQAAEEFMKKNPKVKIKIETFAWPEFYTKWTTGLQAGQVPDVSTALPNHVVELLQADALVPIDDVIDHIGKDRFYAAPLTEGELNGKHYSIPLYSHAQVMWYRKDLLQAAGLEVPKTWAELFEAAKKLNNPPQVYGLSVPMGLGDMMATRFLNFYVRSAGETLITKDGKANLTSKAAKVLDQATLYYQGKTAFDFNSGFQIGGVKQNSPDLLDKIAAAPIPKINATDPEQGIETSNIPVIVWKNSKHPEIAKAFVESLYEKEKYIKFLHSVPGGMLPALKDISNDPAYLDNPIIKQFQDTITVINNAVDKGTAIGMEFGPKPEAGIITSQGVIEKMFQEIILKNVPGEEAAKKAEKELNDLFAAAK